MKKQLLLLLASTSAAILLAVLVVMRGYASLETVSLVILTAFGSVAGLLLWWNRKRGQDVRNEKSDKAGFSIIWLLASFAASAIVAIVQAMHEKWDVGDTIGLGFFLLFSSLSIYEFVRRRRKDQS
jgi:hypothetical protein